MILIWILGLPILGITFLTIKKNKIEDVAFKKYFLILYQGMKKNRIYWEFVNVLRKVFISLINALIPSEMWSIRILSAILFLVSFLKI